MKINKKSYAFIFYRYPPNLVSIREVFVKIKILFMINFINFIHRRHQILFGSANSFESNSQWARGHRTSKRRSYDVHGRPIDGF